MNDYYDNKKKEFNYKMTGWSFIGILVVFLGLLLTKNPNVKKDNKQIDIVDSTWVEFPNTVTKTTPIYFNKTKSGLVFTTINEKYQKGDTILK